MLFPSDIAANRWLGHYRPQAAIPRIPETLKDKFHRASQDPVSQIAIVTRFLDVASEVLPSFDQIRQSFYQKAVRVQLMPDSACYVDKGRTGTLYLTQGRPFVEYLPSVFKALADLAPLPEGVRLPGVGGSGSREEIEGRARRQLSWKIALKQTLLYQLVHELTGFRDARSFLDSFDLAVFRFLKRDGLPGAAEAVPEFLDDQRKRKMEEHVERVAEKFWSSGASISAEPEGDLPVLGERPEWSSTRIDEWADQDARLSFSTGMLRSNPGRSSLEN